MAVQKQGRAYNAVMRGLKEAREGKVFGMAREIEEPQSLVYRLRKRAAIRRSIATRKSVKNNEPDRIADLLEEAATEIDALEERLTRDCVFCGEANWERSPHRE